MDAGSFLCAFSGDAGFRGRSRILLAAADVARDAVSRLEAAGLGASVRVSACLEQNAFLPGPEKLWDLLDGAVAAANRDGRTACVRGLDAVLSLWSAECRARCLHELRRRIDAAAARLLVFLEAWDACAADIFHHPRYAQGLTILRLGPAAPREGWARKTMLVVPAFAKLPIPGAHLASLRQYARECEDGTRTGDVAAVIAVASTGMNLAGIDAAVEQVYTRRRFLEVFCDLDADDALSEAGVDDLFERLAAAGRIQPARAFARKELFPDGLDANALRTAPRMILEQKDDAGREILVWTLRTALDAGSSLADSYLARVLNDANLKLSDFLSFYVCEAMNLLRETSRDRWAEERRAALVEIGRGVAAGAIGSFVNRVREQGVAPGLIVPWLNVETPAEKVALMRFHLESDCLDVSEAIRRAYPLLGDYLRPYRLGSDELDDYFSEYRRLKLRNRVTEAFCRKAAEAELPRQGVMGRDELLQLHAAEGKAALLVVDALGAEYLPLLLALAEKRSVGVRRAVVAAARIPTSTKFNVLAWPAARRRPDIKALDGVVHNGAELHCGKTFEENFVAQLELFESLILPAVEQALSEFEEVVLTADHGATRLAVCAYEQGLARTLPFADKTLVEDWRYAKSVPGQPPPKGLVGNLAGTHWVVRGYDRLAKSGGKLYEMHGGLTYEECLVPFVVFGRADAFTPSAAVGETAADAADAPEFVENGDFDI